MNRALLAPSLAGATLIFSVALASSGPATIAPSTPIPAPKDRAYPGAIQLSVDATDLERRIVHVHETLSGVGPDTILYYPKWLPGTHGPTGAIDRLAGIRISAGGSAVNWTRDPVDVFAFRIHAGAAVKSIDIDFDYLSPTSSRVGMPEISRDVLFLEWNELVLYPAGYFVRQIPIEAAVTLPEGWQFGSALETASTQGAHTSFKRTDLETFIDSPLYAGRYVARFDLDPGGVAPVHLDLFADQPQFLVVTAEQLKAHRALITQAYRLFGSHHYAHYDFLYSLSDQIDNNGLEHHQSSEDGTDPDAFTKWDANANDRDLLSHEFTHSWDGKFRRPADLWTPNYNVPMQDSLLWVYEGQTQYWGQVLAARSGLWTQQQALDEMAYTAAYYTLESGRVWRALEDTTNDEIINPRRPMSWYDWQRFEDYYEEGKLIWLEADTLIRERSGGQHSLDDFARAFYGLNDGSVIPVTYTFEDVVKALNAVLPYDWAAFLRERLDSTGRPAPLEGLSRGGYRLIYTDTPSEIRKGRDEQRKYVDLLFSIGIEINDKDSARPGDLKVVMHDSAAFKGGLTEGARILAVNGIAYDPDVLKDAIRAAKDSSAPIEFILRVGDRYRVARVDYHAGLRYPHLERAGTGPALLDAILTPRP
jgi:predicted metalloprotease with PDZ domain